MKNSDSNLAASRILSYRYAAGGFLYRILSLLFVASLFGAAAGAAGAYRWPAASSGAYQSFSVGDFDEDSKPDLASIQPGRNTGRGTDYWVELQLSTAGRQMFQIVAPLGSVQITSRDVNGDNLPDLVLSSVSLKQPVAILLNKGHGTFSRVDPTAFPGMFSGFPASWDSNTERDTDVLGVPPQSREDMCSEIGLFACVQSLTGFTAPSDLRFGSGSFLVSHSGRAPPFEIPLP